MRRVAESSPAASPASALARWGLSWLGGVVDGDESLGERAFGGESAEQIGDAEGGEKRVGGGAGAEDCGDDDIAQQSEDAGRQGKPADGRKCAKKRGVGRSGQGGWGGRVGRGSH